MNAEQVLSDMRVCFTEGECNNCSRIDDEDCVDGLCKDIIALIESLTADNAELRKGMNADEVVRNTVAGLRVMSESGDWSVDRQTCTDAAALIESLQSQLAESRRRADAAVADLQAFVEYPCGVCAHLQDQRFCYLNCQNHDRENHRAWQWRGPSDREVHHER